MRGRSRRKKRTGKMVSLQKRFLAFMLAFAMIFTNVGTDCMSALQHQETKWTLPLAVLTWWMPSVRPSKTKMWYHRTAWILPTVPQKSLKHCSLETERYMKSIRTSRETAWRQS